MSSGRATSIRLSGATTVTRQKPVAGARAHPRAPPRVRVSVGAAVRRGSPYRPRAVRSAGRPARVLGAASTVSTACRCARAVAARSGLGSSPAGSGETGRTHSVRQGTHGAGTELSVVTVKRPPRAYPPAVPGEDGPAGVPARAAPRRTAATGGSRCCRCSPPAGSAAFFFMPGTADDDEGHGRDDGRLDRRHGAGPAQRSRRGRRRTLDGRRRDYLQYLAQLREQVRRTARRSVTRSCTCTPRRTSCGRWSPRAAGSGNAAPATRTSRRSGSAPVRSSSPPR